MSTPKVSIGMPVYKGEDYIEAAIDSLLNQTFTDFELIICDNQSPDRTREICEAYAAKDDRVRYFLNEQNIGASRNYNRTFDHARGQYFKWAAHDDTHDPTYLEKCVAALDADPSAVLAHSRVQIIDRAGEVIETNSVNERKQDSQGNEVRVGTDPITRKLDSKQVDERFRSIIIDTHWCHEIFGLMRVSALKNTKLQESFYGTDKVLLAEMIVQGPFYQVPEKLFHNRRHPSQSGTLSTAKAREKWNNPLAKKHHSFPRWLCFKGYTRAAMTSRMTPGERLGATGVLVNYVVQPKRWRGVLAEYGIGPAPTKTTA